MTLQESLRKRLLGLFPYKRKQKNKTKKNTKVNITRILLLENVNIKGELWQKKSDFSGFRIDYLDE
jgi:hypothetical protein